MPDLDYRGFAISRGPSSYVGKRILERSPYYIDIDDKGTLHIHRNIDDFLVQFFEPPIKQISVTNKKEIKRVIDECFDALTEHLSPSHPASATV